MALSLWLLVMFEKSTACQWVILRPREMAHPAAGRWLPAVRDLVSGIRETLGLEAYLLALLDARFEMGLRGQPARLIGRCRMVSVDEWLSSGVRG